MSIRFLNSKSGSGGQTQLNIFMQPTEPEIKKGLWLQSNKKFENIYSDDDIFFAGTYEKDNRSNIPFDFYKGGTVRIGKNIYIFGGEGSPTSAYKYNIDTDTFEQLTNIPYDFINGAIVNIENDIYLFGGSSSSSTAYKYNIATDSYSQLNNLTSSVVNRIGIAKGNIIYFIGGSDYNIRRYDITSQTFLSELTIPSKRSLSSTQVASVGNDIYMFSTSMSSYQYYAFKLNTLTNNISQITNVPEYYYAYGGSAVAVGTDIFLFGSAYTSQNSFYSSKKAYKYNTNTDTYTQLTNIPYEFYSGSAVAIDNEIFLIGGTGSKKKIRVYAIENKQYENNSIVIIQGKYYNSTNLTELFTTEKAIKPIKCGLADVYYYGENGLEKDIPSYYGNGTSWIKFKN